MKFHRPRLTYANVISTLSLFLVLGGSAYAASLSRNSVGTPQLKAAAVTPAKLSAAAKATMTGPTGARGERGEQGTRGEQGERGLTGERGPIGPSEGFISGNPPLAAAEMSIASKSVTLAQPGRLYLSGRARIELICTPGAIEVGLYVDGAGVPGSGTTFLSGVSKDVSLFGMTSGMIAAGTHQVELGVRCTAGTFGGGGWSEAALAAILLGT